MNLNQCIVCVLHGTSKPSPQSLLLSVSMGEYFYGNCAKNYCSFLFFFKLLLINKTIIMSSLHPSTLKEGKTESLSMY